MNRLYKPFLILTCLLLFGTFTGTSFAQDPTNSFPSDGAKGIELFPTMSWTAGNNTSFKLEVSIQANFNTTVFSETPIATTTKQISGLSNGQNYYWRVTGIDGDPGPSTITIFTTSTDKYVTLGYPKNGDVVSTLKPTLNWSVSNSVSGLTYEIEVDDNSDFSSTEFDGTSSGTSTTVTTVLTPGTTYNWRVRSKTAAPGNLYSQWSSTGTFKPSSSLSATPIPTILWPQGNPTVLTATPTLSWYLTSLYTGVTIDHYEIDIDADPAFGAGGGAGSFQGITTTTNATTIAVGSNVTSGSSSLTPGNKYYWQVRSVGDGGTSTSSSSGSFTIDIGQGGAPLPILSWPIGNVTVYSITPTLYWYLGTGTTGTITYNVGVSSTASLAQAGTYDIWDGGTVSDQFATVPQSATLSGGTTYYWAVRTNNSANGGTSSAYVQTNGQFTLASNVSNTPDAVLSYPVGGTTVYTTKPSLYWYLAGPPPSGATLTFDIKVSNQTNFTGGITFEYTGKGSETLTNFTVTDALTPGTYYWQVKTNRTNAPTGSNSYTPSAGTTPNSFVVAATASGAAAVPTPLYPTGSSVISSLTPTFSWIANGDVPSNATFDIELKLSTQTFDGNGLYDNGSANTSWTSILLEPNKTYQWRVRIKSASLIPNPGDWSSPAATFSTAATLAPPPPMVEEPINGVIVQNSTPEISWFLPTAPPGALKYRLQLSEDMFMNNIVAEFDDIDAFSTVVNTLKGGTTYYWRVQSKDENGVYSAHSNVGRFTTMSVTGIDDLNIIPSEFEVSQNYPNPFNPATIIRFAIPEASFVILKIYNMLGQEVKTLVSGEKNAGTYNVQWRGDNDFGVKVSSGTYIYRVIAGANIFTKKMILLK